MAIVWASLAFPSTSAAITALVAFGDSYTDTGNAPSSPPSYWNGRFCNGPLWIENLSQTLGFSYNPGNNYAVSGTESDELGIQISAFPGTSDPNVLFAIWSGSNDFGNHLNLGTDDAAWDTRINRTVSSLMTACDLLYQKGARQIVIFNQIDLTRVPYILNKYSLGFRNYLAGKIQTFNSRLAYSVPNLLASHQGLQVYLLDAYSDFNYLLNNYSSLGFINDNIGALNDPAIADKSFSGTGANYVFWDSEHPTSKAHSLVAGWVAAALPAATPPPAVSIVVPQSGAQFVAPSNVTVTAAVTANAWPISQVRLLSNGFLVGALDSGPYTFTLTSLSPGGYNLLVQVTYGSGQTVTSAGCHISVVSSPGMPPPAPWNDQDIGVVGLAGSATYATNGVFTVSGSGSDIWGVGDAFHFLYQPFTGDGSITALVTGQQNTDGFAKAGVMFRETLEPGSRNLLAYITPVSGTGFQDRPTTNGESIYTPANSAVSPYWLKLERSGTNFAAYGSGDGTNWTVFGATAIPLGTNIYAGLAVCSHNNSFLNTASFSNVIFAHPVPPVPPPPVTPAGLTISLPTNHFMQVTITGTTGVTYSCQISTNLHDWIPIFTNLNTSGTIGLQIIQPRSTAHKFYRAVAIHQ